MPRGRRRQTPQRARLDSERRILEALERAGPEGLGFNELKKETHLHQSTLTERLGSLRKERKVAQSPFGRYVIVVLGFEDLSLSNLLFSIEDLGPSHAAFGGPESSSSRPEERALVRSTTFYAIPPLPLDWLVELRRSLHETYAALQLLSICKAMKIPPAEILEGRRQSEVLERLKTQAFRGNAILACVIDSDVLRKELTVNYLKAIAKVATVIRRRRGLA